MSSFCIISKNAETNTGQHKGQHYINLILIGATNRSSLRNQTCCDSTNGFPAKWRLFRHQSIPAAPSTPPRGYCGAFARLVSPGGGAFANFALPWGWAFANPGPIPERSWNWLTHYHFTQIPGNSCWVLNGNRFFFWVHPTWKLPEPLVASRDVVCFLRLRIDPVLS